MFFLPITKKAIAVSIIILNLAIVGDKNSEQNDNRLVSAICDNTAHGLIGAFTWVGMFASLTYRPTINFLLEVACCGLFASIMDLDHFIAARSFKLSDAVNLKERPFLHCTTLVLSLVCCLLWMSTHLRLNWLYKFGWLLAAAFLSHHIRDSKRRGFWMWPFGSTPPTPVPVYMLAQMFLPHAFAYLFSQFNPHDSYTESTVNIV